MGLIVFGPKVLQRHVGVLLSRGEAGVAEKLLNGPEIRSPFQQVGCKTMTHRMRSKTAAGRQPQADLFNQPLNIARVQPAATNTDENRRLTIILRLRESETLALC